jgi:FkbM family methyltransferase
MSSNSLHGRFVQLLIRLRVAEPVFTVFLHALRSFHLYEPRIVAVLTNIHGRLFVDIGSNSGYYSRLLRHNFLHIVRFDPNPRYHAVHIALSDHEGEENFYLNTGAGSGDSLLPRFRYGNDDYYGRKMIRVPTMRFDQLFNTADLVKIDVEGAEFQVLDGMTGSTVRRVLVELHDPRRRDELVGKLEKMGYLVGQVDSHHYLGTLY